MSEESSYTQVQRVTAINAYAESVAQILCNKKCSIPNNIAANVKIVKNLTMPHSSKSEKILQSPTSLKVIQKHFNRNIAVLNLNNTEPAYEAVKIKTAALATLQQENLRIENKKLVLQAINELMTATTLEQTKEKLSSAFAEIKNEHTKVFINTLSSAVRKANATIGFSQMKSETVTPSLIRIVATNSKGINLISEIHMDANMKIDVLSELEGVTDGSCKKIMDAFNAELENLGIAAERKERKSTGGIAQLPYTKKLQKNRTYKREFVNQQVITKDNKKKIIQYINN